MKNPNTSIAGYIGLFAALGAFLGALATVCTGQPWCVYVTLGATTISAVANSIGNISAKDGGH